MVRRQLPLPGEIIKKSNSICRARWSPDHVLEARLIALVASKIRQDDKDFQAYEIHVSELLGSQYGGKDHKEVERAVDSLMSKVVTIEEPDGWKKYNLLGGSCSFKSSAGLLTLKLNPDLKLHYLELSANFTEYNLIEFLLLPSIYSQKIYELLKSWDDRPDIRVDLGDLHAFLAVPDSLKKDFGAFRRRVLEKAHKDISRRTTLAYEWEPVKNGRAVAAVEFVFTEPRKKRVVTKKKEQENIKAHKANNKVFDDVMACFGKTGGDCKEHLGVKHCPFCRSINPRQKKLC